MLFSLELMYFMGAKKMKYIIWNHKTTSLYAAFYHLNSVPIPESTKLRSANL